MRTPATSPGTWTCPQPTVPRTPPSRVGRPPAVSRTSRPHELVIPPRPHISPRGVDPSPVPARVESAGVTDQPVTRSDGPARAALRAAVEQQLPGARTDLERLVRIA